MDRKGAQTPERVKVDVGFSSPLERATVWIGRTSHKAAEKIVATMSRERIQTLQRKCQTTASHTPGKEYVMSIRRKLPQLVENNSGHHDQTKKHSPPNYNAGAKESKTGKLPRRTTKPIWAKRSEPPRFANIHQSGPDSGKKQHTKMLATKRTLRYSRQDKSVIRVR